MIRFALLLALIASPIFAVDAEKPTPAPELADTAYVIATSQMTPQEWDLFVVAVAKKYQSWSNEREAGNSFGSFLNDKFLELALPARGGKIENLKKLVNWMALYKYFDEEPPHYLSEVKEKHKKALADLSKDFTWEKLSELVVKGVKEYVGGEDAPAK